MTTSLLNSGTLGYIIFEKNVYHITYGREQVQRLLDLQNPGESLEFLLQPDDSGHQELFGDSRLRSLHTMRAQYNTFGLDSTIQQLEQKLSMLSDHSSPTLIGKTLEEVEATIHDTGRDLASITAEGAAQEVNDAQEKLGVLKQSISAWRQHYPDTSPLRIDNRKYGY